MTDRDTFAAAALTGLIVAMRDESIGEICESAYGWADAMLRERGVTEPMPKEKLAEVSVTLTDAEREAVESCIADDEAATAYTRAATMRGLLERMR